MITQSFTKVHATVTDGLARWFRIIAAPTNSVRAPFESVLLPSTLFAEESVRVGPIAGYKAPNEKRPSNIFSAVLNRLPFLSHFGDCFDENIHVISTDRMTSWRPSGRVLSMPDPRSYTESPMDRPLPTWNLTTGRHQGFFKRYAFVFDMVFLQLKMPHNKTTQAPHARCCVISNYN